MIQVLSLLYSPTVMGGSVDYFFNLFPLLFRLGIFFCSIHQFTDSSVFSLLLMSSLTEPLQQLHFSVLKLPFVLLYISYFLRFSIYSCFMYVSCFSLKWQVHCSFLRICLPNSQVWITRFCRLFSSSFGVLWKRQLVQLANHIRTCFSSKQPS